MTDLSRLAWALRHGVTLALALVGSQALAYPQYIARGEINCGNCHYSPTGGGLINAWGRDSREATFDVLGDVSTWPGHSEATGIGDDGQPKFNLDLGADARLMPLFSGGDSPSTAAVIPMLLELGAAATYSDWTLYGTVTPRKGTPSGAPFLAFSREHWLMYNVVDGLSLRAGRMVLPFGIRTPDHTQYVREDFGFDKWDQSYALEADWMPGAFGLSAAAFAGDLLFAPSDLRQTGVALRPTYAFGDQAELGLSALASRSTAQDRLAGGVFFRVRPFGSTYVLGEVDLQQFTARRTSDQWTNTAAFLRAGWFVNSAVDVYAEAGLRTIGGTGNFDKQRYAVGANLQLLQWLEFAPQVMTEIQPDSGTQYFGMAQLHLMY